MIHFAGASFAVNCLPGRRVLESAKRRTEDSPPCQSEASVLRRVKKRQRTAAVQDAGARVRHLRQPVAAGSVGEWTSPLSRIRRIVGRGGRAIFVAITLLFWAGGLAEAADCLQWVKREDVGSYGQRVHHAMVSVRP